MKERLISSSYVTRSFASESKSKPNWIHSLLAQRFLFIYLFFHVVVFLLFFFQSRLYSSSSARLCVVQNIFGGSLPRASPPMLAALDVFALK